MQEKRSVFGVLLILSLFLLIPSESKALAEAVKTQANDYYIVVNGKEFKASRASVVLTSTFDAKKVMKDEYSINFYANKEKNIENEYLSVLCSENTNSILFNYNGTKLGDWSEVATTERSFFTYTKSKNLKKISTAGTFVQSDKNGGMGGYTYTTPWKSDFNNLNKRLVLVTESDNADSKTSVSEHIYSDQADYNQCVKDENPYCIKKSGNFLVMFVNSGVGSKKIDFWVDGSNTNLPKVEVTTPDPKEAITTAVSDTIFDFLAEDGNWNAGYWGGTTRYNDDVYDQCVKFVDILKNKSYSYKISVNGGSFNVGSYVVMQTPSYNFEGVKSDGYSISLILEKNQKELKNYLSLSCGADMKKVDFTFNGLDKKLVLVSEVRKNDGSTVTAQYVKGGFSNYTKCLKSNMPFCFKKVGNKLVMFARIGYGSKIVNFWTK